MTNDRADWWRNAVVYQVYIRSFADGSGRGVGDIKGLRSRLPYVRDLGVDALWVNPWYPSPMVDGGYDVADYRDIAPEFGTLAEAEGLIADAHALGLTVLLDIVPNHTSSRHPWFEAALAAGPGSPERSRYVFRPGRGPDGTLPPNNWQSTFGGPAWTRVTEPDGSPGEWYLHLFDPGQPDLEWSNPEVREEFLDILRFWFDRGADGMRIDVAHGMTKHPDLPDLPQGEAGRLLEPAEIDDHPHWDRDDVHEIYREWRKVADSYDPPRMFIAEAWVNSPQRLVEYVRPGGLHTAFNFDFLRASWSADALHAAIEHTLAVFRAAGAPATWVLSNHDVERHATRYGRRGLTSAGVGAERHANPGEVDEELGRHRARAAALLMLALPGSAYLYQGEELGLPEVLDLPESALRDPIWERSGHTLRGRDGCRVPLPWARHGPSYGFGVDGSWLPQPPGWGERSVQVQRDDPASMLSLYREALRLRRDLDALHDGGLEWLPTAADVLAFHRAPGFACVVNFSWVPVDLPDHSRVLLSSVPLVDGQLPPDAAAWLAV